MESDFQRKQLTLGVGSANKNKPPKNRFRDNNTKNIMKKLVLSLVFAASAVMSFGQGQITFQNTSGTAVTFLGGSAVALADSLTAVLWFSATQPATLGSMTPIASTAVGQLSGTPVVGRFGGGVVTTPNTIAAGADGWFGVSIQSGFASLASLGSQVGSSGPFFRPTGAGGVAQPTNLTTVPVVNPNNYGALGSIAVVVPEPSVIVLAVLGAGALLLRRKKA